MIKIAICDDEKIACEILDAKISSYFEGLREPCEIGCFFRAADLLTTPCAYDLFFLDIQMPDVDGIALARKMRENDHRGMIIFITALNERVYDAFEVEALDYITKPIDDNRLQKTLDRAIKKLREKKSLFIRTMHWSKSVPLGDIYYCEVVNRKIHLHTKNGSMEYYAKIEDTAKQLDDRFIRCHRSYLVNLDYVSEYGNGEVRLQNGERVPVSKLRRQDFMQAMMAYMKRNSVGWI